MKDTERMKAILEEMEVSHHTMAQLLNLTPRSFQVMTSPSVKVTPKWVTSFLLAWDLSNQDLLCIECKVRTNGHGHEFLFCDKCAEDESV